MIATRGAVTTEGKAFDRRSLKRVLTSPVLRGQLVYKSEVIGEGDWKPILSASQWSLLEHRIIVGGPRAGTPGTYLLSGILKCGKCGLGLLHGRRNALTTRPVPPFYWCSLHPGGVDRGWGKTSITATLADEAITAIVLEALADAKPSDADTSEFENTLAELRKRQREIADGLASGALSVAVASQADSSIAKNIASVEREMGALMASSRLPAMGVGKRCWPLGSTQRPGAACSHNRRDRQGRGASGRTRMARQSP